MDIRNKLVNRLYEKEWATIQALTVRRNSSNCSFGEYRLKKLHK